MISRASHLDHLVPRIDPSCSFCVAIGEKAGRELGYRVITFKYSKHDWPCKQAMEVLRAANDEGALSHLPHAACKISHAMGAVSHRELSLEQRVGPDAARLIRKNMEGSEYEWMLDLSREVPPAKS